MLKPRVWVLQLCWQLSYGSQTPLPNLPLPRPPSGQAAAKPVQTGGFPRLCSARLPRPWLPGPICSLTSQNKLPPNCQHQTWGEEKMGMFFPLHIHIKRPPRHPRKGRSGGTQFCGIIRTSQFFSRPHEPRELATRAKPKRSF